MSIESSNKSLQKRPYQSEAIKTIVKYVGEMIAGRLENIPDRVYQNAVLLEMATGSGKTFTIGKTIDLLIKLRNRTYGEKNTNARENKYQSLNILVLTNRIDGINQFRDDLVHGRPSEGKASIISPKILERIKISTFHSRADSLEVLEQWEGITTEEIEEEYFGSGESEQMDNLFFSTDRTASLQDIEKKIPYFDIIIIDEAHNLKIGNGFEGLLDKLATHGREGQAPLIIPITATPTNITKEIFGEPAFSYPLAEYLASEYSPSVEYKVVAKTSASTDEMLSIVRMIESAKQTRDYQDKRDLVREIEEKFNNLMLKIPNLDELVGDLLKRLKNNQEEIEETIIFAGSIDEANSLTNSINSQYGSSIAVPYHSQTDRNGLNKLKNPDDHTRIVVAVDMLNESIDLPVVSNIVFWRGTDTARIYLQQFGRGLRGNGLVRYYDYVGSMKNFAWIGGIHESYNAIKRHNGGGVDGSNISGIKSLDPATIDRGSGKKFKILGGDIGTTEHAIDLTNLGFDIIGLQDSLTNSEGIKKELKRLYDLGRLSKGNLTIRNWPSYASAYNLSQDECGLILPKSLRSIIQIFGCDWTLSQSGDQIVQLLEGNNFEALPVSSKEQIELIIKYLDFTEITSADKWRTYAEKFNKIQSGEAGFVLPISIHGVLKTLGADLSLPKTMDIVRKVIEGMNVDNIKPIYTCSPGEEITIEGIRYIGVSGPTKIKGLSGANIIKNAKLATDIRILEARQPRGSKIQLIPVMFIEGLATTYEEGMIYDYQGGKYLAFTFSNKSIPGEIIPGDVVKRIAERNDIEIITGFRNKRGTGINLIMIKNFNTIKNDLYKPREKRSTQ